MLSRILPSIVQIKWGGVHEYFLFVGRIEEIKGIDILLEAFARLPDEKLVVAGTGLGIEKYKANATRNVTFAGYLGRTALNDAMAKAKAVIVSSQWYETFGMVVIEAFSNGVPVIVGDIGNIGALVCDGITGKKFQYDSSDSLIAAIREYEKMDWNVLRQNAQQCYADSYAPNINYNRLLDIYITLTKA